MSFTLSQRWPVAYVVPTLQRGCAVSASRLGSRSLRLLGLCMGGGNGGGHTSPPIRGAGRVFSMHGMEPERMEPTLSECRISLGDIRQSGAKAVGLYLLPEPLSSGTHAKPFRRLWHGLLHHPSITRTVAGSFVCVFLRRQRRKSMEASEYTDLYAPAGRDTSGPAAGLRQSCLDVPQVGLANP